MNSAPIQNLCIEIVQLLNNQFLTIQSISIHAAFSMHIQNSTQYWTLNSFRSSEANLELPKHNACSDTNFKSPLILKEVSKESVPALRDAFVTTVRHWTVFSTTAPYFKILGNDAKPPVSQMTSHKLFTDFSLFALIL